MHAFLNVAGIAAPGWSIQQAATGAGLSAPNHAWTWDNRGVLKGIPHGAEGFPGIDKGALGLKCLGCAEAYDWIWVVTETDAAPDFDSFLVGRAADFA